MSACDEHRRKRQFRPDVLARKFGLTEGEARVVLAAAGKSRRIAKLIARSLQASFRSLA